MKIEYKNFDEFYPYYLSQHKNKICRLLHFIGSCLVLIVFFASVLSDRYFYLITIPFIGYGFAWIGHFFFEKNKPATFDYFLFSLRGDWRMFKEILLGKISIY